VAAVRSVGSQPSCARVISVLNRIPSPMTC
jgi:hypothetical protein